jgi:hypothetical protein
MQTNQRVNGSYPSLDTPLAAEQQLMQKYDAAPYVAASSAGSIPFIDFGNRYVLSGASYSPGGIYLKTWSSIADALADPQAQSTQGIVGTANVMTATICALTGNTPTDVCNAPEVAAIRGQLPPSQVTGGGG